MDVCSTGDLALRRGGEAQRKAGGGALQQADAKLLATSLTGDEAAARTSMGRAIREPLKKVMLLPESGGVASEHIGGSSPKCTDSRSGREVIAALDGEAGTGSAFKLRTDDPIAERGVATGLTGPNMAASRHMGSSPVGRNGPADEAEVHSPTGNRTGHTSLSWSACRGPGRQRGRGVEEGAGGEAPWARGEGEGERSIGSAPEWLAWLGEFVGVYIYVC